MKSVCLDAHVLIWGLQGNASSQRQEMIPKAKNFLKYLSENNIIILIPSAVLAELLMYVPPEEHERFIQKFSISYQICPFGKKEAIYFGKIWYAKNNDKTIEEVKEDLKNLGISAKSKIKFDILIIATALAHKADKIISHDDDVKKLAEGFIKVEEIPDIPTQEKLNF